MLYLVRLVMCIELHLYSFDRHKSLFFQFVQNLILAAVYKVGTLEYTFCRVHGSVRCTFYAYAPHSLAGYQSGPFSTSTRSSPDFIFFTDFGVPAKLSTPFCIANVDNIKGPLVSEITWNLGHTELSISVSFSFWICHIILVKFLPGLPTTAPTLSTLYGQLKTPIMNMSLSNKKKDETRSKDFNVLMTSWCRVLIIMRHYLRMVQMIMKGSQLMLWPNLTYSGSAYQPCTAELRAINLAFLYFKISRHRRFIIVSYSKSILEVIQN